jgi:hypothetical protein
MRRIPHIPTNAEMDGDPVAREARDRTGFIAVVFATLLTGLYETRVTTSWPTFPGELLPFGADVFTESMLQWHRFLQDNPVFAVCGPFLRICRAMLLPSMTSHSLDDHVVDACRGVYDRTLAGVTADENDHKDVPKRSGSPEYFDFKQVMSIRSLR